MKRGIILFLQILLIFMACESELYPPTDPPVLGSLEITSDSYRDATDTVIAGDTVYLSVGVSDPENDPVLLTGSLQLDGSEALGFTADDNWISDGTTWNTWFETTDLATGAYSLFLTATDSEGNVGDPLSQSLTIAAAEKENVTTADIALSGFSYVLRNESSGEPFTITISITNNSSIALDLVEIPFTVTMDWDDDGDGGAVTPTVLDTYTESAYVSSIPAGSTVTGYCRINILNTDRTYNTTTYAVSDCIITIY